MVAEDGRTEQTLTRRSLAVATECEPTRAGIVGAMSKRIAALALTLVVVASPVAAQGGLEEPLEDMLRYVPAEAVRSGGLISYVDLRAVETARPGASTPSSFEAWQDWRETDEGAFDQWVKAYRGVIGGAPQLMQAFPATGDSWPSVVGFDYFDVDRLLSFGAPPTVGVIAAGRFDPAAISTAHEARGFSSTDQGNSMLICSEAGCEDGLTTDLAGREPADPFGGFLGRKQPLVVTSDLLLSSATFDVVSSMQEAGDGTTDSVAGMPEVGLALASLSGDALLRQASIVPPDAIQGSVEAEAPALPAYDLLFFADTATADEQITHVVLVFESVDDARAAAEALPARIERVGANGRDGSLGSQLERRGLTAMEISMSEAADGIMAAVDVALHAPLAGADESSMDAGSSELYRLLIMSLAILDTGWLVSDMS